MLRHVLSPVINMVMYIYPWGVPKASVIDYIEYKTVNMKKNRLSKICFWKRYTVQEGRAVNPCGSTNV